MFNRLWLYYCLKCFCIIMRWQCCHVRMVSVFRTFYSHLPPKCLNDVTVSFSKVSALPCWCSDCWIALAGQGWHAAFCKQMCLFCLVQLFTVLWAKSTGSSWRTGSHADLVVLFETWEQIVSSVGICFCWIVKWSLCAICHHAKSNRLKCSYY